MKIKFGISTIAFAVIYGSLKVCAQTPAPDHASRDRANQNSNFRYNFGQPVKASKLIGAGITDAQNEKLGKVKDFAIDLQNGRILEVIVGNGGVLGADERFVAVPPGQITCDPETKALQLNIDRGQFKSAPSFKLSEWESNVHETNVAEVYQYYSVKPYFNSEVDHTASAVAPTNHLDKEQLANGANANPPAENGHSYPLPHHLGEIQRASKLIGEIARNTQNEKLGKIENLMVDVPSGRVVEVILASGGFLGIGNELSAIPPQAFRMGIRAGMVTLDVTKDALTRAPHFKAKEWESVNNPQNIEAVYKTYNIQPYFDSASMENGAQNVRDHSGASVDNQRQVENNPSLVK